MRSRSRINNRLLCALVSGVFVASCSVDSDLSGGDGLAILDSSPGLDGVDAELDSSVWSLPEDVSDTGRVPPVDTRRAPPEEVQEETQEPDTVRRIPGICGDAAMDPDEACDDGNNAYGDGCRPDCTVEGPFLPGALLLTEVLANPAAVSDGVGEWVEVYNPGEVDIDLRGWMLTDDSSVFQVPGLPDPVLVPAGGYLVLGSNASFEENGAAPVDAVWSGFTLPNSTPRPLALLWNGTEMDRVNLEEGFPKPKSGASLSLDPHAYDSLSNDEPGNWCHSSAASFGQGDKGTPGGLNEACDGAVCGDGVWTWGEACDDGNTVPGDGCESDCILSFDSDSDGHVDTLDNCPSLPNPAQLDTDVDGIGDVCDEQDCGNGDVEGTETCDDGNLLSDDGCSAQCTVEFAGALMITEFLSNPKAVGDSVGEWIEVRSTRTVPIDLLGWTLADTKNEVLVEESLVVPPLGTVVFARSVDPLENGGVQAAHTLGKISLNQSGEVLFVLAPDGEIVDQFEYTASFPLQEGVATSLDPSLSQASENDAAAGWCLAVAPYGDGDLGSPGLQNPPCSVPSCGNDVLEAGEECDDGGLLDGDGCNFSCQVESLQPGDLTITEWMAAPVGVVEPAGEWVEVKNESAVDINLRGLVITSGPGQVHTIVANAPVWLKPGAYFVLGYRSLANGGVPLDYGYVGLEFANDEEDEIAIAWNGTVLDSQFFGGANSPPVFVGQSTCFSDSGLLEGWCPGMTPYGDVGNQGTPGEVNLSCKVTSP